MRKLTIIVTTALLTACGGGGGSSGTAPAPLPAATVPYVSCADVYTTQTSAHCSAQQARAWYDWALPMAQASTIYDAGTISRSSGQLVTSLAKTTNPTGAVKTVWVDMTFDANCAGQPGGWDIMPKQAVQVMAGATLPLSVGGMCGDMPLGARQLIATVYDTDGTTILDTYVVQFTLVQ